jgi:hypothetical protein
MTYTWKEKLFLIKPEETYGEDAGPTAVANAVKTLNGSIVPIEGDEVTLDVDYPELGAPEKQLAGTHVSGKFDVALSGSGTAGTAPSWGAVMRMCSFAEVITAGTKVEYELINTGHEAMTIYAHLKGALHRMTGARGKLSIAARAKNWLLVTCEFRGLLMPVTTGSLPAATFTGARELLVNAANTTFSIDGYDAVMEELTLDMGTAPAGRFLVNQESIELPDPVPTGSINIEDPGVDVKDFFALADARSKVPLTFTHGTLPGNIVGITAPAVQVGPKVDYAQSEQFRHLNVPLQFTRHAQGPLAITVQ